MCSQDLNINCTTIVKTQVCYYAFTSLGDYKQSKLIETSELFIPSYGTDL